MIANDKTSEDYVQLHKMLFNPFGLYESGYIEKAVRGATRTLMAKPGSAVSQEVKNYILKIKYHELKEKFSGARKSVQAKTRSMWT